MIVIIDKYDAGRICDFCGEIKIIQRSYANTLLKKEAHYCVSCMNVGRSKETKKGFYWCWPVYYRGSNGHKILPIYNKHEIL
jgi:hypothetical protein